MGEFSPWHLLIVAAVFVLLFGARRLPDAARSLGKSARILKTELKDLHEGDDKDNPQTMAQTAVLPAAPVPPPAVVAPPAPVVAEAPQTVTSGDQTPAP
jgi:sec-independent protein translocase protein TatA